MSHNVPTLLLLLWFLRNIWVGKLTFAQLGTKKKQIYNHNAIYLLSSKVGCIFPYNFWYKCFMLLVFFHNLHKVLWKLFPKFHSYRHVIQGDLNLQSLNSSIAIVIGLCHLLLHNFVSKTNFHFELCTHITYLTQNTSFKYHLKKLLLTSSIAQKPTSKPCLSNALRPFLWLLLSTQLLVQKTNAFENFMQL